MSNEFVEPAFPTSSEMLGHNAGMTLRDYFAAKIIAGLISGSTNATLGTSYAQTNLNYAGAAYAVADAMLIARGLTP